MRNIEAVRSVLAVSPARSSFARLPDVVEQLAGTNVQRAGDEQNAPHSSVARAELDISDVIARYAHSLGKLLLRQSAIQADLRDPLAE